MFTNSLFLLNYKPNSRRVPRLGRVWLAQAHTTLFNVMHPKRLSWTSPLPKANRPRLVAACNVETSVMWVFTRLLFKYITRACGVNFRALFTHPQTKPRQLNTAPTPPNPLQQVPKIRLCGTMNNFDMSA
jgi:hypothetical protein